MSAAAIVMMLVAVLVIWGGLTLAILNLTHFSGEEPTSVQREM